MLTFTDLFVHSFAQKDEKRVKKKVANYNQ